MLYSYQTAVGKKVKQPTSCAFLTLAERPWPQPLKHWKEEGRRVHRISQGFRSILVMTCQAKFLRQPPPGKTTWPFSKKYLLWVSSYKSNYSFFTRLEGTVYFLGVETNLN